MLGLLGIFVTSGFEKKGGPVVFLLGGIFSLQATFGRISLVWSTAQISQTFGGNKRGGDVGP